MRFSAFSITPNVLLFGRFDGANSSSQLLFLMFGDMSLSRLQLYG